MKKEFTKAEIEKMERDKGVEAIVLTELMYHEEFGFHHLVKVKGNIQKLAVLLLKSSDNQTDFPLKTGNTIYVNPRFMFKDDFSTLPKGDADRVLIFKDIPEVTFIGFDIP